MSQTGYSKETYLQAKQILERQRLRDEQELEERRINLFSLSPRAMEIEREVAQTSLAAARARSNSISSSALTSGSSVTNFFGDLIASVIL